MEVMIGSYENLTLDECKTKCLSDPKCKFINVNKSVCFLHTAEQCADNQRKSHSGSDIYQAVESPVATPGNVITPLQRTFLVQLFRPNLCHNGIRLNESSDTCTLITRAWYFFNLQKNKQKIDLFHLLVAYYNTFE